MESKYDDVGMYINPAGGYTSKQKAAYKAKYQRPTKRFSKVDYRGRQPVRGAIKGYGVPNQKYGYNRVYGKSKYVAKPSNAVALFKKPAPVQSESSMRKKLIQMLAAPDYYNTEVGDQAQAIASSSTLGIACKYFTFNSNAPYGSMDPGAHQQIAAAITTLPNADINYVQTDFKQRHVISNQFNTTCILKGWLLEARRDFPAGTTKYASVLADLGQAFLNSGVGTNAGTTNTALVRPDVDPFNANGFLTDYKIVKKFSKRLAPGHTHIVYNNDHLTHTVRPTQFIYLPAATGFGAGTLLLQDRVGERYWLFRIETGQLGDNAAAATVLADLGAKINMVTYTSYEFKRVSDNQSIINLVTPSNIGTNVAAQVISSLTGLVVAEAAA